MRPGDYSCRNTFSRSSVLKNKKINQKSILLPYFFFLRFAFEVSQALSFFLVVSLRGSTFSVSLFSCGLPLVVPHSFSISPWWFAYEILPSLSLYLWWFDYTALPSLSPSLSLPLRWFSFEVPPSLFFLSLPLWFRYTHTLCFLFTIAVCLRDLAIPLSLALFFSLCAHSLLIAGQGSPHPRSKKTLDQAAPYQRPSSRYHSPHGIARRKLRRPPTT